MKNAFKGMLAAAVALMAGVAAADGTTDSVVNGFRGVKVVRPDGRGVTVDDPLQAGDQLQIKFYFLNAGYETINGSSDYIKNPWKFETTSYFPAQEGSTEYALAFYTYRPRVALSVSGRTGKENVSWAYVDFEEPVSLLEEKGKPVWSVLNCVYTVKPGDLAFPLDFLLKDLATSAGNCTDGQPIRLYNAQLASDYFRFMSVSCSDASVTNIVGQGTCDFQYDSTTGTDLFTEFPDGSTSGGLLGTANRTFVKALDFDANYYNDGYWRKIRQGSTEEYTPYAPRIEIPGGASTSEVATTVYLYTTNAAVAKLANGTEKWYKTGPDSSNYVSQVTFAPGTSAKTFTIEATGTEGETADIFLSTTPTNIYNLAGTLITNWVKKTILIAAPPEPGLVFSFEKIESGTVDNGDLTVDVPQGAAYKEPVGVLRLDVTRPPDYAFTVNVGLALADCTDLYGTNILRISEKASKGYNDWNTNITVAAGETGPFLRYVYALGTTDAAANEMQGIRFTPVVKEATAKTYFGDKRTSATLYLEKVAPTILTPAADETLGPIIAETPANFEIEISDNWRNYVGSNGTYTVSWNRGDGYDTSFTLAATNGILKVPVKYYHEGTFTNGLVGGNFTVTSPDGVTASWKKQHEGSKFYVQVTAPAKIGFTVFPMDDANETAVTSAKEDDTQCYDMHFTLEPHGNRSSSDNYYVFIEPMNEAASNNVSCPIMTVDPRTGKPNTSTVFFKPDDSTSLYLRNSTISVKANKPWLRFVDGDGNDPALRVVLCTSATYDPDKVVAGFSCDEQTFNIINRAPSIKRLRVKNGTVWDEFTDGQTNATVILGASRQIQVCTNSVNYKVDVDADWGATNSQQIALKWEYYKKGKSSPSFTYYTFGANGATNLFEFTEDTLGASGKGVHKLVVSAMDKDMAAHDLVQQEDGTWAFSENASIKDSNNWGDPFTLYFPVTDQPQILLSLANAGFDGGFYEDQVQTAKSEGGYSSYPGVYVSLTEDLEHEAFEVWLKVEKETTDTGFVTFSTVTNIKFAVDDAQPNLKSQKIVMDNADERAFVVIKDMDGAYDASNQSTRYKVTAYAVGNTDYQCDEPLYFEVRNIKPYDLDLSAGGGYSTAAEAKENPVAKEVAISFRWAAKDITPDATNKFQIVVTDGGLTAFTTNNTTGGTFSYAFSSEGAHQLILTATDKDGESEKFSLYFYVAPSKTFRVYPHNKSVSAQTSLAQIYTGSADGLGEGRWTTTESGDTQWETAFGKQSYATADRTATFRAQGLTAALDTSGYDNYFYGWILDEQQEGSATFLGSMQIIAPCRTYSGSVVLPSDLGDDGAYETRQIELIFSREYLKADNMGDLNADGIPDVYANKVWTSTMTTLYGGTGETPTDGSDLKDVSALNDDEDYLPEVYGDAEALCWLCDGAANKFTALLEIRGAFATNVVGGLNEAGVSDRDLSTLAEYCAFTNAAGLAGVDVTNEEALDAFWKTGAWTPEKRTDPTTADTNGDGFPDGWQYYFWYLAHNGTVDAKGNWARYAGRKFDRAVYLETGAFAEVGADVIEKRFDPTEKHLTDGSVDATDTDGDGLSDYEEYLLGTNPCDCDSNGDGLPDGWEIAMGYDPLKKTGNKGDNADGDAMAYQSFDSIDVYCAEKVETGDKRWFITRSAGARGYTDPFAAEKASDMFDAKTPFAADFMEVGDPAEWPVFLGAPMTTNGTIVAVSTRENGNFSYDNFTWTVETVMPREEDTPALVLRHDQVKRYGGFDPREAWTPGNANMCVTDRWDPAKNTDEDLGLLGITVNATVKYTALEEFSLMRFRHLTGQMPVTEADTMTAFFKYCTVPNVVSVLDAKLVESGTTYAGNPNLDDAKALEIKIKNGYRTADETGLVIHGADTNRDGVPDGWELYTGREPIGNRNLDDEAADPTVAYEYGLDQTPDILADDVDTDGLDYRSEFNGTESCNQYATCLTVTNLNARWVNKFWPTDPGYGPLDKGTEENQLVLARDTDGDNIKDGAEGMAWEGAFHVGRSKFPSVLFSFIYGDPTDDHTCCIRGGGMNPCTVDTDRDMLPDAWERQFAGVVFNENGLPAPSGEVSGKAFYTVIYEYAEQDNMLDQDALRVLRTLDGLATGTNATALGCYISGGMDATDPFDAGTTGFADERTGTMRNFDFDSDGLQNFQEYLTQALRCFRYDDAYSQEPAAGKTFDYFTQSAGRDGADSPFHAALGYFQTPPCAWDWMSVKLDDLDPVVPLRTRAYSYMYYPNAVCADGSVAATAGAYATTDPRRWDSDNDGMDDFYELFHGLNPLLGAEDRIADAYAAYPMNSVIPTYLCNDWTAWDPLTTDANLELNFVAYPWLTGLARADPDGDGLRNDTEKIVVNQGTPQEYHTDPTPLWMTDSSNAKSLTVRYYHTCSDIVNYLGRLQRGWNWKIDMDDDFYYTGASAEADTAWMFSFEENEGFDTDGDGLPDGQEVVKNATNASDPLNFTDPTRRQAMYFTGTDSAAVMYETSSRAVVDTGDIFRNFTVECWVKPEVVNREQVILERSAQYMPSTLKVRDEVKNRANFRLGISASGRAFGLFDNNDAIESESNQPISCQKVESQNALSPNVWTHLALSYDGTKLVIYVNGKIDNTATTSLIPANGVSDLIQSFALLEAMQTAAYTTVPSAFIVGSSLAKAANFSAAAVTAADLSRPYQGYVDEIRVWDGARTTAEINADYTTRYTFAQVNANHQAVYEGWYVQQTRAAKTLTPELVYHYNFDSRYGAVTPADVFQVPVGFDKYVQAEATKGGFTTADLACTWWKEAPLRSTVYTDCRYVPWIQNTVGHLPSIWGAAPDSRYWSTTFEGLEMPSTLNQTSFDFPNTANPYTITRTVTDLWSTQLRLQMLVSPTEMENPEEYKDSVYAPYLYMNLFELRGRFSATTDLLPVGGAYVRIATDFWDGQGAMDLWEYSGKDADTDNLPDWWETYARSAYAKNLTPFDDLSWYTEVTYNGVKMPAWQAYLRDLAKGMHTENGQVVKGDAALTYASTSDADGNGLPDWWERLYWLPGSYGAHEDPDNDGLSNYQEYLISEVYPATYDLVNRGAVMPFLSPLSAISTTNQLAPDYFLRYANTLTDIGGKFWLNEYFGEIVTDHDFMEDWWENQYDLDYTSSALYDAYKDADGDGWSTFAECRYCLFSGTYVSDVIDRYLDGELQSLCYPQPAIGIRTTYYGNRSIAGKGLVVRTMTENMRVDATFVVNGSDSGTTEGTKFIGGFVDGTTLRGFLNPGAIVPGDGSFYKARMSSDKNYVWNYYWYRDNGYSGSISYGTDVSFIGIGTYEEYRSELMKYPHIEIEDASITWEDFARTVSDANGWYGDVILSSSSAKSNVKIGTINYRTGEYEIDLTNAAQYDSDLDGNVFRCTYTYRVGQNWPQTIYVSQATTGYVREGLNTVEVFADLDGDGVYTVGEPYGVAKNVEIGWHKVPAIAIELKDDSPVMTRTAISSDGNGEGDDGNSQDAASALTKKVVVRRTMINGASTVNGKAVPVRTFVSKDFVLDDRAYVTEADVLASDKPDLDWRWLIKDAAKLGLAAEDINAVTYSIESVATLADGTTSNTVLTTFAKTFNPTRAKATLKAPVQDAPVYSAAPTFTFASSDATMTAFRLQIADAAGALVYDSGAQRLPAQTPYTADTCAYAWTAPVYAGAPAVSGIAWDKDDLKLFADNTNYQWRVLLMNAKFRVADDTVPEDDAWSDWSTFDVDIANVRRHPLTATGYGNATAAVRYYGPATNDYSALVIVEAFENADFTGQALAQIRARTDDIASITDITTTNAVLRGIEPGTVYLRAYIDLNRNGQRDDWEPWGYANRVGEDVKAIYNPKGVTVSAATVDTVLSATADVTIYIEDTDVNQNELPDCLEADSFGGTDGVSSGNDTDRDGIADGDEENYATDAAMWDTDSDGMPDGWEAKLADLDPNFNDAEECADNDVMAFADVTRTLVSVKTTRDGVSTTATYILPDGAEVPSEGDDVSGRTFIRTYDYPIVTDGVRTTYPGVGTNVTLAADAGVLNRVTAVAAGTVVLVHAQVYDAFGFDATTANPTVTTGETTNRVYGAYTKAFTALDKYLLIRYFEAIGLGTEQNVNVKNLWSAYSLKPYDADNDEDGLPDGWELYVMFGPNGVTSAGSYATPSATPINPWTYGDSRTGDADGDTLTVAKEYNRGVMPSNPWSKTSLYDYLTANDLLLDGTTAFTDDQAKDRFNVDTSDTSTDSDNDQITDFEEWQAYFLDPSALTDLNTAHAWSDGTTPDYFRAAGDSYLGAIFNGGDFIEADYRTRLGMDEQALVWAGTREMDATGWDYWSVVRNMQTSKIDFDNLTNAEKLDIVTKYLQLASMNSFTGSTLDEVHQWITENDDKYGKGVDGYSTKTLGITVDETAEYLISFLGMDVGMDSITDVYAYMKKYVDNENRDTVEYPVVEMNLTLKHVGAGSKNISVLAYQVNPHYPELGEQVAARWDVNPIFDAGVAQVTLGEASSGSLKQGSARFVAFVDSNADNAYTMGETYGETKTTVGYLGGSITIALGEANAGFPAIRLGDGSNTYSTVALIRTKVNGVPLYNEAKGAFIIQMRNNASREALYPSEFETASYVGIDRNLAKDFADSLATIEDVTYEIVRLREAEVANLNLTNLNHYVHSTTNGASVTVDAEVNEEITFKYSPARDEAKSIAVAGSKTDDVTFTFTVPTDTVNTKFWLYVVTNGVTECYGGTKGFPLTGMREGKVILDSAWFAAKGVSIPAGEVQFGVVLGNDKYGRPDTPTCAFATAGISDARVYDARIRVNVKHPTQTFANGITVAAYDQADLAKPVAWTNGNASGEVTLAGLRAGVKYYVAAWYVMKAGDGRADASVRRPYDTWGYLCNLTVTNASGVAVSPVFDAVAVEAKKVAKTTYDLYLQDTDWNDNGKPDREDCITAIDGSYECALEPLYGFDIGGVEETELFSDASEGDVFAYATVSLPCVATERNGIVTWYVVTDLEAETTPDKTATGIRKGTLLSELRTLAATYLYDYGRSGANRLALGTNVTVVSDARVTDAATKEIILVHAQVYSYFGYSPNTANGALAEARWVNTKSFTSADKNYVTNYLANVLGVKNASRFALPAEHSDADAVSEGRGDGILDGWELYVMFGPKGVRPTAAEELTAGTAIHSPWNFSDRDSDLDGDGVSLLHEYDGGAIPTDPWSADSDADGISDYYAWLYDLKGQNFRGDNDNDQLSNFMEFLISRTENYGMPTLDANRMASVSADQVVPDYFVRPSGMKTYLGEMFADHDMIEDWYEDLQPTEDTAKDIGYSRFRYDASDEAVDGWDKWSYARYGLEKGLVMSGVSSNATTGVVSTNWVVKYRYEVDPDFAMGVRTKNDVRLRYNGDAQRIAGKSLVVKAWSEEVYNGPNLAAAPDACWVFASNITCNTGLDVTFTLDATTLQAASSDGLLASNGRLRQGKSTYVFYVSDDGDGTWTPGAPYGVVSGVNNGAVAGEDIDVELTDVNPSIPRIDLLQALVAQQAAITVFDEDGDAGRDASNCKAAFDAIQTLNDRGVNANSSFDGFMKNFAPEFVSTNINTAVPVRVRVVRSDFNITNVADGTKWQGIAVSNAATAIVFDRTLDLSKRPYLTEADLIRDGGLDLDWDNLAADWQDPTRSDAIPSLRTYRGSSDFKKLTNAAYRIVIGEGSTAYTTNNANLGMVFINVFESERTACTNLAVAFSHNRPTFSWKHEQNVKAYPAFRLQILGEDSQGREFYWDSKVQRAPARDIEGTYRWSAPVYIGMKSGEGVFEAGCPYTFTVDMLDAKWSDSPDDLVCWLDFTATSSDELSSAIVGDYGPINVAVKYFGPLATNLPIRVEAFTDPYFGGTIAGVGYVANAETLASTDATALNAQILGLPIEQTYYVRAFIDSNGNGERDAGESWGYGCYVGTDRADVYTPRPYYGYDKAKTGLEAPTAVVYIEDVDADGDGLPDAQSWERVTTNSPYVVGVATNAAKATAISLYANLAAGTVDLPFVRTLSQLENGGTLSSGALGYALALSGIASLDDLKTESEVTITRFDLSGIGTASPAADIELKVDTRTTVDGETLKTDIFGALSVKLAVQVWHTDTLASAFTKVGDPVAVTVQVNSLNATVSADALTAIGNAVKVKIAGSGKTSGFFKVTASVAAE